MQDSVYVCVCVCVCVYIYIYTHTHTHTHTTVFSLLLLLHRILPMSKASLNIEVKERSCLSGMKHRSSDWTITHTQQTTWQPKFLDKSVQNDIESVSYKKIWYLMHWHFNNLKVYWHPITRACKLQSNLAVTNTYDSSNTSRYKPLESCLPFSTYCFNINFISNNTAFTQMQEEVFSPPSIQCFTSEAAN